MQQNACQSAAQLICFLQDEYKTALFLDIIADIIRFVRMMQQVLATMKTNWQSCLQMIVCLQRVEVSFEGIFMYQKACSCTQQKQCSNTVCAITSVDTYIS